MRGGGGKKRGDEGERVEIVGSERVKRQWKGKKSKTDKFKSDDGLETGENLAPHREGGKGLTIRDERGRKSESLESESEKVKEGKRERALRSDEEGFADSAIAASSSTCFLLRCVAVVLLEIFLEQKERGK